MSMCKASSSPPPDPAAHGRVPINTISRPGNGSTIMRARESPTIAVAVTRPGTLRTGIRRTSPASSAPGPFQVLPAKRVMARARPTRSRRAATTSGLTDRPRPAGSATCAAAPTRYRRVAGSFGTTSSTTSCSPERTPARSAARPATIPTSVPISPFVSAAPAATASRRMTMKGAPSKRQA